MLLLSYWRPKTERFDFDGPRPENWLPNIILRIQIDKKDLYLPRLMYDALSHSLLAVSRSTKKLFQTCLILGPILEFSLKGPYLAYYEYNFAIVMWTAQVNVLRLSYHVWCLLLQLPTV